MFSRISENTLYVFGAVNFLSIPFVWAFYPETANRTLEEVDLLFASSSPLAWDNERHFRELKASGMHLSHRIAGKGGTNEDKESEKGVKQEIREVADKKSEV